jgi:hypothetical protein
MYAIFDSEKNFISYSDQKLDSPFYNREIPLDKTDILKWRWNGNYDDGEMVKIEDVSYSNFLNEKFFNEKYPFDYFISILLKQLFITSKQNKNCQIPFEIMVKDYIQCFESNETYLNLLKLSNKKQNEN